MTSARPIKVGVFLSGRAIGIDANGDQAAVCEQQEAQLRKLRAEEHQDLDAIGELAAQHAASAKALAQLMGVLRATPRATMRLRGASRQIAQAPRVRPWEQVDDG